VHELAHVRRHDYLVSVIQSVIETILFYHPRCGGCRSRFAVSASAAAMSLRSRSAATCWRMRARCRFSRRVARRSGVCAGSERSVLKMRIKRILEASATPKARRLRRSWLWNDRCGCRSYFVAVSRAQSRRRRRTLRLPRRAAGRNRQRVAGGTANPGAPAAQPAAPAARRTSRSTTTAPER